MRLTTIDRGAYRLVLAPQGPYWVATNHEAARLILDLADGGDCGAWVHSLASRDGLSLAQAEEIVRGCLADAEPLFNGAAPAYEGRGKYLQPHKLRELWIHINNRCNFTCRHCLVSSGPTGDGGLPTEILQTTIREAQNLGVHTFFLTGGEPLLRPDLPQLLALMLEDPEAHAVVLTNGSLINEPLLDALKGLDLSRLYLQVSLDGSTPELNDLLRSPGAFERTTAGIRRAVAAGLNTTVATVVLAANLHDLPNLLRLLPELGVRNWHLMWQHRRERGADEPLAPVKDIIATVLELQRIARTCGVCIDNIEYYKAIINGEPWTIRDGTNAAWDSLAVYTDGGVYPSAALVGIESLCAGHLQDRPLRDIWLNSPVLEQLRQRSCVGSLPPQTDPLAFLHGGGDPEHSFFFGGSFDAPDPYLPLYRALLLAAADEVVAEAMELVGAREDLPVVYHAMGQDGMGCPVHAGARNSGPHRIDFAHSNCVLLQDVVGHSRQLVRDYYADAAVEVKGEICCPVQVDRRLLTHIPQAVLERSYGCGSPIFAAEVRQGETVVDLGSGAGIECFVASRLVGSGGRVIGVDMTPNMVALATSARQEVAANLGYDNVRFVLGYLESVPLRSDLADLVISNCVVNLSPRKLRVFSEAFRILKPGGRLVISDITADGDIPEGIKFNPRLRGECISGALRSDELLRLLTKVGFEQVTLVAQLPWRRVEGVNFQADTVFAIKPAASDRGLPYVGIRRPADAGSEPSSRHLSGCTVCGAPLQYLQSPVPANCALCGRSLRTRSRCAEGHFVCDQCHGGDYLQFLRSFLAQWEGVDPVEAFLAMREAYPFPVHGPEHHALVPAAFLVAYHNLHGAPTWDSLWAAVETGASLAGGSCAFWGACSAALGIGVAFSAILDVSPLCSHERGAVQGAVSLILSRIADLRAPRCCRREALISLQLACELSSVILPAPLATSAPVNCDQIWANNECIGARCPFAPRQS